MALMATVNPFDLLGDDDSEDFSQLLASQQQKIASMKAAAPPAAAAAARAPAKLPTKPLPPAQAGRSRRVGLILECSMGKRIVVFCSDFR